MKTLLKIAVCLLCIGAVDTTIAQQSAGTTQPAASKKAKKQSHKKQPKAVDNKIAVSDQAQPGDKAKKKQPAKKDKGVSNK